MIQKSKICGGVVLFNPTREVLENIGSYIMQVDRLFVVDNSTNVNVSFHNDLNQFRNIEILRSGGNRGIAAALNELAVKAIKCKYNFLLTMDQDSRVPDKMIHSLIATTESNGLDLNTIGIISPYQYDDSHPEPPQSPTEDTLFVITSGNLLNLQAYQKTGPFNEDLFIDRVDHDYCLRLHLNGFSVVRINTILMDHQLGSITRHHLFGRVQYVSNHSPVRRYYLVRNGLFIARKYRDVFPDYSRSEIRVIKYEILKIILFEKCKASKMWHCALGYFDYRRRRFGQFKEIHG